MGFGHQTVYKHLGDMEAAGLVSADVPAEDRHGRTVHYRLRTERLRTQLNALLDDLS